MHDLGAFIWIVLVVIGIISSVSRRAKARSGPPVRVGPAPAAIPPAVPSRVARTYARPAPEPVPRPKPPPAAMPAAAIPEAMAVIEAPEPIAPQARPARTGVLRGLFEDRRSLVRAVIAAEVLGPPAALREQRLWSPRHSDPST